MASIVWSEQAYDDLDDLLKYLGQRDFRAAEEYCREIETSCRKLAQFPDFGRRYDCTYRVLVVRNHLVFYRHDQVDMSVTVTRIPDGRRDLETLFSKDA